jgi:GTP pyrophosphokinase
MEEKVELKELLAVINEKSEKDINIVSKAYEFAQKAHEKQLRKNGDPYFNHLFATAKILAQIGMTAVTVSAGLLHDVIEDTEITAEILEKEFGKEITFLVEGVTKLGHLRYRGGNRHNESLRKLFVAMSKDIRVLIIKLCDRLHNMRTLEFIPKEKQQKIAKETLEIYAPLAYRLGIRKLNRELEDISFKYVYPEEYKKIESLVKSKRDNLEDFLEKFIKSVKKELAKNNITDFQTDYRVKGLYSLYKKLNRKGTSWENIYDILAIRIIVPSDISECYKILGIIHSVFKPMPGRIKDFIAFPKPNGYKSLHTTVFTGNGEIVEIQIKTKQMQLEAEYGVASHMLYKKQTVEGVKVAKSNPEFDWLKTIIPKNNSKADIPKWVKELVLYQTDGDNIDSYINDVKNDFLGERIFIFTPKGDVLDLPKDCTVIDFAYGIHSDIGDHTSGAKINGKFVSIDTTLSNGDVVEVVTRPNSKPTRKWLDYAKTTLAKRNIRNFIEKNK